MWSVWLVFCYCDFHSVCSLMDEDKRVVEASWWNGLPVGKGGSCSVGSVNLWTNFLSPPCSFVWGQTIVGVIVITVTFKRTVSMLQLPGLLCSVPLTMQQAAFDPHLCWRLLETHRLVWLRFNIILNYYRYLFNIFLLNTHHHTHKAKCISLGLNINTFHI